LKDRVFEVHPEVAFWKLNSECVLRNSKKTLAGREERMLVLRRAGVSDQLLTQRPPGAARADDLLDAIVSSVIAERILNASAKRFPDPPGRDSFNLPIAIWA
jgi:predicted RNase H-like nuclease